MTAIERQDPEAAATAAKTHMINGGVRIKSADAEFWTVELRHLAQSLDGDVTIKKSERQTPRRSNARKLLSADRAC